MLAHFRGHLVGQPKPGIVHGQQESFYFQFRIEFRLGHFNRIEQLAESFQCEIFALDRNQYAVGGDQGIERHEAQRRRTIDQDKIVAGFERFKNGFHPFLSVLDFEQLGFGAHQVDAGRQHVEFFDLGTLLYDVCRRGVPGDAVVYVDLIDIQSQPRGRIRLRIGVDQQDFLADNRQAGS